jgi:tripartite-type tricarboxylate transporter receptor subunit TctC
LCTLVCAVSLLAMVEPAAAQAPYPNRPIRLVVGYPPGGPVDITARELAKVLSESLGQQVVVDNRAGATGIVGNEFVAKAAPDGYTLLLAASPMVIHETLYAKLPYDTLRDFTLIGTIGSAPLLLVTPPGSPAGNVQELIALAKSKPGELSYASPGTGSVNHLAGESLKTTSGIDVVHVPYKGAAPAETDVMGGRVAFMFDTIPSALPKVRAGQMRALAVTSAKRTPIAPDIPTVAESGLPGFDAITWYGVMGPANLPADVAARLNTELNTALDSPAFRERLGSLGLEAMPGTPQQFVQFYRSETVKWGKVVKSSGAKAD